MGEPLKEIGGFELIGKIGQGGMGTVFKARQKSLDRVVALKVLPPSIAKDAKFIERFQREARACAKLNHPNIVQGVDVGKDSATGVWYFAMEFVDGSSALSLLKSEGKLSEERALTIVRDIARALECAASNGIVHRDIKPDNILLTSRGEAKLADLGLAKQLKDDASLTQSGQAVGTPFYMAPEQVRGRSDQIDIRSDIYALGGTLFHFVTGQPPFSGETSAVIMSKHLTEPAPKAAKVNPDVSDACSRMIEQMMHKDREKRIQSPADLITQIERVLRGEAQTTRTAAPVSGSGSRRKKEPVPKASSPLPLVLGGGAVAVVLIGAFALTRGSAPEARPAKPEPRVAVSQPSHAPRPTPQPSQLQSSPAPQPIKRQPEPAPVQPAKSEVIPDIIGRATPDKKSDEPEVPTPPIAAAKSESKTEPKLEPKIEAKTESKLEPKAVVKNEPAGALPLEDLLSALRENAPKKAVERLDTGNFVGKESALEALKLLDARREARQNAIKNLVGQPVKLDSTKGSQNGKLVAFKNNVLQLEKAIFINGESRGVTQVSVPLDELTPASLERLAPVPAPASPADFAAVALGALASNQLDAADAALAKMPEGELRTLLAADIKTTRLKEREAQAKAAWAKIETRSNEAPTQSKAKQLLDELAAFSKKFADSDFFALPETTAKIAELKEKFDRLSLGLDPRVLRLFKGKVLNYDPRTQVITLGYDLQTKDQTDDFIDSLWAPPGDQTGLTWKKGELKTFCKGTADRVFNMPQFVSSTMTITLDCKKIDTSRRNRFEVDVSFHGLESEGKTPKVFFKASEKACHLFSNGADVRGSDEILFKEDGKLELSCIDKQITVKWLGKPVLEHTLGKANDHAGFWIGGGWDSGITFTKIQVSARLDHAWLTKALESVTPPKR